jgi:hypothetical protein
LKTTQKEENMVERVESWNFLAGNYHQTSILEALFLSGWCYIISYFGNQMLVKAPVFFFQNKWALGKTGLIGLATTTSRSTVYPIEMSGICRTAPCFHWEKPCFPRDFSGK